MQRFVALLFVLLISCSLVVDSDSRGGGVGTLCTARDGCHAGSCENGLCTAPCASNVDCPAPSRCFANRCQLPLSVGGLWVGVVAGGEGWTLTHQEGMTDARAELPFVGFVNRQNVVPFNGSIAAGVDELARAGTQVIIANSFSQRDEILKKADQYPNISFLTCASYIANGRNAISYGAHSEQAWYIAGKVAALKSQKKRLGYIGSFITPEVVRHINAFYLGARSIEPTIELEVAWLGFWYDYNNERRFSFSHPKLTGGRVEKVYREELLAYRLLEDGCDVIGHGADNQRSVRLIERLAPSVDYPIWSFSNDNRNGFRELDAELLPKGPPMKTCLGSPYFNWAPLYARILDQIHRGTFDPHVNFMESMQSTPDSIVGFQLNPTVGLDDSAVRSYINEVASKGWTTVFDGAYETTGQRDKDGDGKPDAVQVVPKDEPMTDNEYRRVCWFAKGIVERTDPTVAGALVPARVPDAARLNDDKWVADIQGPKDAPPKVGLNCNENY